MASTGIKNSSHHTGILAMEIYFPNIYVNQEELEQFDGVLPGKYTVGLGQKGMGFCTDREDICSISLTALHNLLEKHKINRKDIGRLEVGTESLVDKSKSVKSVLMQLFSDENCDVEGTDTVNACYGGTAALINAVNWIESASWDGRYAVVVAADIAVYAEGPARPTGGAGCVAMLIGPNAPIVLETGTRASFMKHAYDFYKPVMSSEYPRVEGKLSIECYFEALDSCYKGYKKKVKENTGETLSLRHLDFVVFHSPFCKLVRKSFARLMLSDFLDCNDEEAGLYDVSLLKFKNCKIHETYFDKTVETAFLKSSEESFIEKTRASLVVSENVGNMYCASVYGALTGLIAERSIEDLDGKRVVLFSYGSGLASSMLAFRVYSSNNLAVLKTQLNHLEKRLKERCKKSPKEFNECMKAREAAFGKAPYAPTSSIDDLLPGTYYLDHLDDAHRRSYKRILS